MCCSVSRVFTTAGIAPLFLLGLTGCLLGNSTTTTGTDWGTFAVVGTRGKDTCGSNASSPRDFTVTMSIDGSTVHLVDGDNEASGELQGSSATLVSTITSNVDGTSAASGPCNLTQTTTVQVTLDSASAPTSFTGTATYAYAAATSVSTSNDCTDQLKSSGGSYATLPCTIEYSLTAKQQ